MLWLVVRLACVAVVLGQSKFQSAFDNIYKTGIWGTIENNPASGGGSEPCDGLAYLLYLQHLISRPDIYSIVEIGFGDWEMEQHLILENKSYTGFEVASAVMRKDEYNTEYRLITGVQEVRERADLIIIRDVMQHWPRKDIQYAMKYLLPRFKYGFLTNDHTDSTEPLSDIEPGNWRQINIGLFPNVERVAAVEYVGNTKVSFLYTNPELKE